MRNPMRKLGWRMAALCVMLAPLLAAVFWWSYVSQARDEAAALRYFGEALFEDMEEELRRFVEAEETRAVDEYAPVLAADRGADEGEASPLAEQPAAAFVVGYFQVLGGGVFQTPHVTPSPTRLAVLERARDRVLAMRDKAARAETIQPPRGGTREREEQAGTKAAPPSPHPEAQPLDAAERKQTAQELVVKSPVAAPKAKPVPPTLRDRYLRPAEEPQREALGQLAEETRRITPGQALNLSARAPIQAQSPIPPQPEAASPLAQQRASAQPEGAGAVTEPATPEAEPTAPTPDTSSGSRARGFFLFERDPGSRQDANMTTPPGPPPFAAPSPETAGQESPPRAVRAEVAPLTSALLDENHAVLYRRVVVDGAVARQGFVVNLPAFLAHLERRHYRDQPLEAVTRLTLTAAADGLGVSRTGGLGGDPGFAPAVDLFRTFPRPFAFLSARLTAQHIPMGTGRYAVLAAAAATALVLFLGLTAVWLAARAAVELAQRRAGFVSSVTHELKTPLTSIRMYSEMLEEGMASDESTRRRYLGVIRSEAARLSRLIGNVLEFSRLERRERPLVMELGRLDDVFAETRATLAPALEHAGFNLAVENALETPFPYDREAMTQVLINLVENSVKFGAAAPPEARRVVAQVRRDAAGAVRLTVRDFGPGAPAHALPRLFEDFYRADDSLTRQTAGAGLGLALVKGLVEAMGGSITARNAEYGGFLVEMVFAPPGR